jgi:hypothetical protein
MSEAGINFMKLFEMFGGTGDASPEYGQMLKMMELMAAFRRISAAQNSYRQRSQPPPGPSGSSDSIKEELEARLRTPELVTIKSAIPLLEPKYRRNMKILVKLIEIQRLMDVCREVASACNIKGMGGDGWRSRMLAQLRPYLSQENKIRVDALIKMMEINNIFTHMKIK